MRGDLQGPQPASCGHRRRSAFRLFTASGSVRPSQQVILQVGTSPAGQFGHLMSTFVAQKIIAAISGFVLVALAVMFGTATSPDQSSLFRTAAQIAMFVAVTSLALGVVFGRAAIRVVATSACLALLVMWLGSVGGMSLTDIGLTAGCLVLLFAAVGALSMFGVQVRTKLITLVLRRR